MVAAGGVDLPIIDTWGSRRIAPSIYNAHMRKKTTHRPPKYLRDASGLINAKPFCDEGDDVGAGYLRKSQRKDGALGSFLALHLTNREWKKNQCIC